MVWKSVVIVAIFLAGATRISVAAENIDVGAGWSADIFTDKRGAFTGCVASTNYNNGTSLFMLVDQNLNLGLGFSNPQWKAFSGVHPPLSFQFDFGDWKSLDSYRLSDGLITIPGVALNQKAAINFIKTASMMNLQFGGLNYSFNLTHASETMMGLARCAAAHISTKSKKPDSDSRVAAMPPAKIPQDVSKPKSGETATGTGIKFNTKGYVLTNHHVVNGCKSIEIIQDGKSANPATLVREDKSNDLAVLKSNSSFTDGEVATFRTAPPVKAGDTIAVYGFPLTGILSQSGNIVGGNVSSLAGLGDDARYFQISAPVQPGNSGGPLLDESGNVVGIVNARIDDFIVAKATGTMPQNVNFSIKANIATNFLDTHSFEYSSDAKTAKLPLSEIATKAKSLTAMVICHQ